MLFIALAKFKTKLDKDIVSQNLKDIEEDSKGQVRYLGIYWTLGRYDTVVLFEAPDEKVAMNPMAIMPGTFAMLDFDLGEVFPPDIIDQTGVLVSPIGDPYLFVESAFIEANLLRVGVFSDPTHGSGKLYLNVDLLFPP